MSRTNRKSRTVITQWTDPHSGIAFTVESDHSLTPSEMRDRSIWANKLQADLRDGSKPLVTVMHDAPSMLQAATVLVAGAQQARRMMAQPSQLQQARDERPLSVAAQMHALLEERAPVMGQASARAAEAQWVDGVGSVRPDDALRQRMPHVGERFVIPGEVTTREITEVFSAFGEIRFRAHSTLQVLTFERVANTRNQWRAWQQPDAAVFSL